MGKESIRRRRHFTLEKEGLKESRSRHRPIREEIGSERGVQPRKEIRKRNLIRRHDPFVMTQEGREMGR